MEKRQDEMDAFIFRFEEMNYHLYLFDRILYKFKLPCFVGKWLHKRGYAVISYVGLELIDDKIK